MRILILGGDGYLGWASAMYFSRRAHTVAVVDNFTRRLMHLERGTDSLTPIQSLPVRLDAWREVTGRTIESFVGDIQDWYFISHVIRDFRPDAIVHYGEIPSAPYSMIDVHHAVRVHENNVNGTLNVLWAIHEHAPDAHLIKLGTMGEYGTPNIDIEEGYITIEYSEPAPEEVAPTITGPVTAEATVGEPFTYTPELTGDPAPTVTLVKGSLPQGLSLDPATGIISGTPQDEAGGYPIALTAANGGEPE